MGKIENYIKILPEEIQYAYGARYKIEKTGYFSWYLPTFDIYFSSKTIEDGMKRGKALTQSFFTYWILQQGFDAFIDKLKRLGYKAESNKQIQALKQNRSQKPVIFYPEKIIGDNNGYDTAEIYAATNSIRA